MLTSLSHCDVCLQLKEEAQQVIDVEEHHRRRFFSEMSAMQEISAYDPANDEWKHIAILLWRFRQTQFGETATTTWRKLLPAPQHQPAPLSMNTTGWSDQQVIDESWKDWPSQDQWAGNMALNVDNTALADHLTASDATLGIQSQNMEQVLPNGADDIQTVDCGEHLSHDTFGDGVNSVAQPAMDPLIRVDFAEMPNEQFGQYLHNAAELGPLDDFHGGQIVLSMDGSMFAPLATLPSSTSRPEQRQHQLIAHVAGQEARHVNFSLPSSHHMQPEATARQLHHLNSPVHLTSADTHALAGHGDPSSQKTVPHSPEVCADGASLVSGHKPSLCADGELLAQLAAASEHVENLERQNQAQKEADLQRLSMEGGSSLPSHRRESFDNARLNEGEVHAHIAQMTSEMDHVATTAGGEEWTILEAQELDQSQAPTQGSSAMQQDSLEDDWTTLQTETLPLDLFAHHEQGYAGMARDAD